MPVDETSEAEPVDNNPAESVRETGRSFYAPARRWHEFFQDENGKLSATRLVLLTMTVAFTIATIADTFSDVTVDREVYAIIQTIFGFGLGGQAVRTTVNNYRKSS